MVASGTFYSLMVDPFLKDMRKRVAFHIEKGQDVIDVACGTGAQVRQGRRETAKEEHNKCAFQG
jgi:ubiquinone/menaquinone biosynthesis C-methylase UbiE